MDPVTLIVAALAAGAGKAVESSVEKDVKAAYEALRDKLKALFAGKPKAELVLAEHAANPEVWKGPLSAELKEAQAQEMDPVVVAAQNLMAVLDAAGTASGKYAVDARKAKGMIVGDHGTQHNTF